MQITDTQKRFIRRWGEMGTRWGIARSTAMVHEDTYINRPSLGHERWINNAFVVMPE